MQFSSALDWENGAAHAVGGAPGSARKVLRLAQASDDLPGQFALVGVGEGWRSLQGSLEAGFAAQLRPSIGLPGRAHLHVRAAGGRRPCLPGHLEPSLR